MKRSRTWVPIQAVLLALPLVVIAAWVTLGGYHRVHGPGPATEDPKAARPLARAETGASVKGQGDGEAYGLPNGAELMLGQGAKTGLAEPGTASGATPMSRADARSGDRATPDDATNRSLVERGSGPNGEAGEVRTGEADRGFRLRGLPPPGEDYAADRLEDRVDGAADWLRGLGCTRLVVWRLTDPAADLEILLFEEAKGASQALARDAGPERDAAPGDEASVGDQAVLFRRGAVYVRLLADPDAMTAPGRLLAFAERVDRALREARPWNAAARHRTGCAAAGPLPVRRLSPRAGPAGSAWRRADCPVRGFPRVESPWPGVWAAHLIVPANDPTSTLTDARRRDGGRPGGPGAREERCWIAAIAPGAAPERA